MHASMSTPEPGGASANSPHTYHGHQQSTARTPTTVISSLSNHCSLSSDLHHISGRRAVLRRFTHRRESTSPGDPAVLVLSFTYKNASQVVTDCQLTGTEQYVASQMSLHTASHCWPPGHLLVPSLPSPSGSLHLYAAHPPPPRPPAGVCCSREQGLLPREGTCTQTPT